MIDHSVYPDVEHGEGFEDDFRWLAVPMEPSFYPAPWETLDALEGRVNPCKDRV